MERQCHNEFGYARILRVRIRPPRVRLTMLTPYGISLSESEVVIVVKKYPKKTSTNTEASAADQLDGVVLEVSQSMRRLLRLNRQLKNQHFRGQSLLRLERQREEMCQLAEGKLVFESTETWRAIYEDVLSACQCKRYLSVALVQTEDYWRGLPGDRSVSFNGLLVEYGFYVHRIFIIDDFLWPPKATLPSKHLYTWIVEQYGKGIQVGLLRLSDLDGRSRTHARLWHLWNDGCRLPDHRRNWTNGSI